MLVNESVDSQKVKIYGPGIEHGEVREGIPTHFMVDCKDAGPGRISVKLTSSNGKQLENVKVEDMGEGVYAVNYVPPKEGTALTADVRFADEPVPCKLVPQQIHQLPIFKFNFLNLLFQSFCDDSVSEIRPQERESERRHVEEGATGVPASQVPDRHKESTWSWRHSRFY